MSQSKSLTLSLELATVEQLRRAAADFEALDGDTVVIHNLPVRRAAFNRQSTTLLLKRPAAGLSFILFVDVDLQYQGDDPGVSRAFAAGVRQPPWRALQLAGGARTLEQAVQTALSLLGFEGEAPRLETAATPSSAAPGTVLSTLADDFAGVADDEDGPTATRVQTALADVDPPRQLEDATGIGNTSEIMPRMFAVFAITWAARQLGSTNHPCDASPPAIPYQRFASWRSCPRPG